MSSPMIKLDTACDQRQQAASSVVQDMSSARLRILGDLMDARKKAEAHEQEFLKTIHSENAAFSKIVSLFEDSVREISGSIVSVRDELNNRCTTTLNEFNVFHKSLSNELTILKQELSKEMDLTKETFRTSQNLLEDNRAKRDEFWQADFSRRISEISDLKDQVGEDISRISSEHLLFKESLLETIGKVQEETRLLSLRIEDVVRTLDDRADRQLESFKNILDERECQLVERFDSHLVDLESRFKGFLEDQIAMRSINTEQELMCALNNRTDAARHRLEDDMQDISNNFESRFQSIEKRLEETTSVPSITQDEILHLEKRLYALVESSLSSRINSVIDQIGDLDSRISAKLTSQESALCAIGSSGYFYDWTIVDAKTKLESLGLFSSNNKFVSSEIFSIGPYSNLQLRLYPLSSSLSDSPSVWLIHSPSGTDINSQPSLPVYVDLGIGRSKRGLCRMKKVQELFGHWVWEACGFDRDFIRKEVELNGTLIISVEISMRQWLKGNEVQDGLPDSPMSAYTFAAGVDGGHTTPHLPLRPMSTNPFENQRNKSALTPRRMSWAMFGDHADDTVPNTSNPFSS
jgi:hypothetical protein